MKRPNILFILADQMQWGAIAGRSPCKMPNVQRLVDAGLLFQRSYTPSGQCCPARAMLISGAYGWHCGVYNQMHVSTSITRDMVDDVVTYSQRLKDAGYWLGYAGKWHASRLRSPLDFGFDAIACNMGVTGEMLQGVELPPEDRPETIPDPSRMKVLSERIFQWHETKPFPEWRCLEGDESQTQSYWIADGGIRLLKRAIASGKPWHLEVHFQAPHDPYVPLRQYVEQYDGRDIPIPPSYYDTFEGKCAWHRREAALWHPLSEDDYRQGRVHYYAYCQQLDAQIGRVLDALDASGTKDETMVVFSTDHGDMVGAHRMYAKGWQTYEECYRIPMVIAWPGRTAAGAVSPRLVQLHDLAHTFVEVAGAAPLPHPDGRSLTPLFDNPQRSDWDDEILCAFYVAEYLNAQRMIITGRYKFVHNGLDVDEMYDLQEDPHELRNLVSSPQHAEVLLELKHRMFRRMERYDDPWARGGKWSIRRYLFQPGC